MSDNHPIPVKDIPNLKGFQNTRWVIAGAVILLLMLTTAVLAVVVVIQQNEIKASCDFFRPLTSLPVEPAPHATAPSKIGVQIVGGSRIAYAGIGCSGSIPKAAPDLLHWEQHYHVHIGP